MPKVKTGSGAKKRFKVSGTGKLIRRHAMKSHNLEHKSSKRKRGFRKDQPVAPSDVPARQATPGDEVTDAKGEAIRRTRARSARKVLEQAKGYWGLKNSHYTYAKEQVEHSLTYAYRDRKNKKRTFRRSGSSASTPRHARTASRTTSSSRACTRPGSSSTASRSPTSRCPIRRRSPRSPSRPRPRSRPTRRRLITSAHNAKLRLVRQLLSARKHRDETGLFAVESEDLVDAARAAGIEPVELLVAGEDVEVELLAALSTLGHAPRVVGVFRFADLPRGTRDVVLALWKVSDPGNVGTLLRTADAFGAAVALSPECADPLGPRALRASAGAIFRVPLVGWDDAPARRVALVAHGGVALRKANLSPPLTILLGAEREGLPRDLLASSDATVTIPSPGEAESLNVAAAGAIALYELSRGSG